MNGITKRSWADSLPSPPPSVISSSSQYAPYPYTTYNNHSPLYNYDYPYCYHKNGSIANNLLLPSRNSATMAQAEFQYERHVDLSSTANGVHAINTSSTPDFNVPFVDDDQNNANDGFYFVNENNNDQDNIFQPHLTSIPCTTMSTFTTTAPISMSNTLILNNDSLLTQWILDDFYKMETESTNTIAYHSNHPHQRIESFSSSSSSSSPFTNTTCSIPSPINTPSPVRSLNNTVHEHYTSQKPIRKSKKRQTNQRKKRQQPSSTDIHCTNCYTSNTPLWRRNGLKQPLCNACGLFLKLHGIVRPLALKTDVIKKRNRKCAEGNDNPNQKTQRQLGSTKNQKQPSPSSPPSSLFWS